MVQQYLDEEEEEGERTRFILQKYRDRLKVLRLGQEYSQKDDIPNAVKAYVKYLQALADYYSVEEKNLKPALFKGQNSIVEILMVSQVYWDLSKSYDRAPRLTRECQRCLNQFILFSLGFKFQYLNSEMLRKYIKRRVAHNPKLFEDAYQQMRDESKKCYIATHCYGENHLVVQRLRKFKSVLSSHKAGNSLIDFYYHISTRTISCLYGHSRLNKIIILILKPILKLIADGLTLTRVIK
jgi:hypothetical protein